MGSRALKRFCCRSVLKLKESLKHEVEYKEYPMQHSASLEEIQDISAFIRKILATK